MTAAVPEPPDSDYFAHTRQAEQNREVKAKAIARHLYEQSISADTAGALPTDARRAMARAAGYTSASDLTWAAAVDLLVKRAAWDAAHPPAQAADTDELMPDRNLVVAIRACLYAYLGCAKPGVARGGHAAKCEDHTVLSGPVAVPDPALTVDALRQRMLERAVDQREVGDRVA